MDVKKRSISMQSVVILLACLFMMVINSGCVPGPNEVNSLLSQSKTPLPSQTLTGKLSVASSTPAFHPTIPASKTPWLSPTPPTPGPTLTPAPSEVTGLVVFDAWVYETNGMEIFLADLATGEIRQLTHSSHSSSPVWSPDGQKIAFVSAREEQDNPDIYIMNRDGTDQQKLTTYKGKDMMPDWSPDGSHIAFVSNRDGNDEIYVLEISTGRTSQVTWNEGSDFDPVWSERGDKIAFSSDRETMQYQLFIMNKDGSGVQRLTHDKYNNGPAAWCPKDECVIYERREASNNFISKLYRVDFNGEDPTPLLSDLPITHPELHEWHPRISASRRWLTFTIVDKYFYYYAFDIEKNRYYFLGIEATNGSLFP